LNVFTEFMLHFTIGRRIYSREREGTMLIRRYSVLIDLTPNVAVFYTRQ